MRFALLKAFLKSGPGGSTLRFGSKGSLASGGIPSPGFVKARVAVHLMETLLVTRKLFLMGSGRLLGSRAQQQGEESGADLGGLKPFLHKTVGKRGLVAHGA
jgi:hypothetical protein